MNKDIKIIWSVPCLTAPVDSNSNMISLLNVVEELEIHFDPKKYNKKDVEKDGVNIPLELNLVTLLSLSEPLDKKSDIKLVFEATSPDGKKVSTVHSNLFFDQEKKGMRVIMAKPEVKVTVSGEYIFKLNFSLPKKNSAEISVPVGIKVFF